MFYKLLTRTLIIIMILYVGISIYIIEGYSSMNDKLNSINDTLLKSCTNSKIDPIESDSYK